MNLLTLWTPIVWMALVAVVLHGAGRHLPAWARNAVAAAGVAGAGAWAIALRLSVDTAPAEFPWPLPLGRGPSLAADSQMFPFAVLIVLVLAGAMAVDAGAWARWARAMALAAASLLSIYAENLLALALAWILLEALLFVQGTGISPDEDDVAIGKVSAFLGFAGLVAIVWAWHETQGASLRPYEVAVWTPRARALLTSAALIRMGAFPFVSRRLFGGPSGSSPMDAASLSPLIAGLALAQRAAALGAPVHPTALLWIGAAGALICGLGAWLSVNPRHRVAWALGAPLGILLMMWAERVVPAPLAFAAAAASLSLGFGLWTIRMQASERPTPWWARALVVGIALAPVAVVGMGPLSPATACVLALWQALLNQSALIALVPALAGQMFAMAALLRPGVAPTAVRSRIRTGVFALWSFSALAQAFWPRGLLLLSGSTPALERQALSPGAWAALLLPLLGAMALPELQNLEDAWREYGSRALRVIGLGWLQSGLRGLGNAVAAAVRGLEALLHGDNHALWALTLLLCLILMLGLR